jgi:two-component system sensor histidine kinase KdpD
MRLTSNRFSQLFPFCWRDLALTAGILACASGLCALLRFVTRDGGFAPLVFVLAVLLVSRLTTGYLFGLTASVLGVMGVNFIFTYPYWKIDFSLSGYPLTFLTMLTVSLITCTMTTRVKQQDSLRLENEREKMRANLLRSVSHDIRTPLTSIVGATSTLLDPSAQLTASENHQLLEDVNEDAQWLIRVVENLLSITRVGDSRADIKKEPEAAEEVLGEAVRKFRKQYPQVEIQVQAPNELLMVPMDAILIEQVLANLLENAVLHGKHTTAIRLSVWKDRHYARFSVEDNGCGIPPQILPSLFNGALPQEPERASDGKRNMGLGLTVCRTIVAAHGGSVEAHNLPSGGAEFSFRLPLAKEEAQ